MYKVSLLLVVFIVIHYMLAMKNSAFTYVKPEKGRDQLALQNLTKESISFEEKDIHGLTPLHVACINNKEDVVRFLLEKGCSANLKDNDGTSPLQYALMGGRIAIAKLLLQYNADPKQVDSDGNDLFKYIITSSDQKNELIDLLRPYMPKKKKKKPIKH
jgi:ankyrin repeat protein